ncbi:hypothetical protein [uncultured Clostridium sp.]|uniref:hypothetical protein n=1 Tax=uncultured Clostridium sp. TaxID=59620 RepID=UPI002636E710|nr:hypothetical protein [uncultured Clostridium sp.]
MKKKTSAQNADTTKSINSYAKENNLTSVISYSYDVENPLLTEENKHLYGNNSNLHTKEYVPAKDENIKNQK